jgi:LysR family glycine cleavage system transcriptional activator
MQRRLPPFAAIRAFEAAARHLSFKDAAEELCVTPSAISHQIRVLEEFLGAELFRREANRIDLTEACAAYLAELSGLLDRLDESTRRIADHADAPLRVLSTPGFASRWLAPRLDRLPGGGNVAIRVSSGAPSTDFARNDADVVVHWGDAQVAGVVVEPFMESCRYPVASPELRDREGLKRPEDLLRMTLLHDDVWDAWERWFRAAGVAPPALPRGPSLAHCELTLTAAEKSQGVALAYDAMARGALATGALVRLFDQTTLPITIYSVACQEDRADDPRIRAFSDWLFNEAIAEGVLAANAPARWRRPGFKVAG